MPGCPVWPESTIFCEAAIESLKPCGRDVEGEL